jgi:hypothetical protein
MLSLLLASLSLAAPVPAKKAPDLFPLAKGNKWEYQVSAPDGNFEVTVEVIKSEARDGKTEATLSHSFKVGTAETRRLTQEVSADAAGVDIKKTGEVMPDKPLPLLKFPATPGTTLTETVKQDGVEVTITQTVKEPMTVAVPAGTFEKAVPVVVTTEVGGTKATCTTWYMDGVGMVKEELTGPFMRTLELKKFTPAK